MLFVESRLFLLNDLKRKVINSDDVLKVHFMLKVDQLLHHHI